MARYLLSKFRKISGFTRIVLLSSVAFVVVLACFLVAKASSLSPDSSDAETLSASSERDNATAPCSIPAGFIRIQVPDRAQPFVSAPFQSLEDNPAVTAVAGTNEPGHVWKWDITSQTWTNLPAVELSDITLERGEGFAFGGQSGDKTAWFVGEVNLEPTNTIAFNHGLTLFSYPFSSAMRLEDTTLWQLWEEGKGGKDEIVDATTELTTLGILSPGRGYWYRRSADAALAWVEPIPYADIFGTSGLPRITGMSVAESGESVTLSILCSGEEGEKLDIYWHDFSETERFDTTTGWHLAQGDLEMNGGRMLEWTDSGGDDRAPVDGIFGRVYVVGRSDVDAEKDGVPDSREKLLGLAAVSQSAGSTTDVSGAASVSGGSEPAARPAARTISSLSSKGRRVMNLQGGGGGGTEQWQFRAKITFTGYTKSQTLTNFPALVILNTNAISGFSYSQFSYTNGADLRFQDETETTELNYEIERWNPAGSSFVWVQAPAITGTNTSIYAYWANTNVPGSPPVYSTNGSAWSAGYSGVWHIASSSGTNSYDSTSAKRTGYMRNASDSGWQAGLVGNAFAFDGVNDFMSVPWRPPTNNCTTEFWLKTTNTAVRGFHDATLTEASGYGDRITYHNMGDVTVQIDNESISSSGTTITNGQWRHVVHVFGSQINGQRLYVDGVLKASGSKKTVDPNQNSNYEEFGWDNVGSYYFQGMMDEIRVSAVTRSADWLWACYMNQGSNSAFNVYGAVETTGGGQTNAPTITNGDGAGNVTSSSATLNGNLTSTGGAPTTVYVYWGISDGGTNKAAWSNSISMGTLSAGAFSTNITGLAAETLYHYRSYATNVAGDAWASSTTNFMTLPVPGAYTYKMKIAFTAYNKAETLSNFPALVVFNTNLTNFSYSQFISTNGYDLRLTSSNETTTLNYEIERWNPAGSSYVWVQVPTISSTNDYIWACWGDTNTSQQAYTTNGATWSQGSQGYSGVWHVASSSGTNAYDSTAAKRTGYMRNSSESNWKTGLVAGAVDFDGTNDYLVIPWRPPTNNCTTEFWLKTSSTAVRGFHDATPTEASGYGDRITYHNLGDVTVQIDNEAISSSGTSITNGQWRHVVHVFGTAINGQRLYVDGVLRASGSKKTVDPNQNPTCEEFGWDNVGSYYFQGMMDEIRVSSVTRSSNWLWACWLNTASNAVFNGYGSVTSTATATPPEINNDGGASNVTATTATLNGNLTSTGGAPTTVYVYWGASDGGSNKAAWANSTNLGVLSEGMLSFQVSGLSPQLACFYRCYATNSAGETWASSTTNFTTLNAVASISGTISYDGDLSGQIWIVAVTNSGLWSTNCSASISMPDAYSIANVPTYTNRWLKAFRDSDGDGTNDYWEAIGSYSNNPVYLTADVSGVDMTLTNPVADAQIPETVDTSFSTDRGFYTTNISVTITSAPNAVIHYTLDCTAPSWTNGYVATGTVTIVISNTTCLRAIAYETDKAPTDIDTQTYIFLSDVIARSNAPSGYPTNWSWTYASSGYSTTGDYGMDTNVTQNSEYSGLITNAMKSIPILSIVMDPSELFGSGGIYYQNTDEGNERSGSMELIYPDGREGCHANCSIKPHSRFYEYSATNAAYVNLKRSFRLSFKKEYGPAHLNQPFFESAPVNAESAAQKFDKLILRAGANRSYAGGSPDVNQVWTTYTRDQWGRDSQTAMRGSGVHGTFAHLYLNGMYWGLYNPSERPDEHFLSEYFGGEDSDWYSGKDGFDLSGDNRVYTNLLEQCAATNTDWTSYAAFTNIAEYLDLTNFCDYVLLWWYCGGGDWEEGQGVSRNYYVGNRLNPDGPISYYCWDMEVSWAPAGIASDGAWVKPSFLEEGLSSTNGSRIAGVFQPLWNNAEFRTLFADRLYKHCFNDGALSDTNSQKRWLALCNFIDDAMIAESARWGDAKAPYTDGTNIVDLITRNDHWYRARDYVYRLMDRNSKRFLIACRRSAINSWPLYPIFDPPEFNQDGGVVTNGFQLTMTNDGGVIYFATNGLDPRAIGGSASSNAVVYSNAVTISGAATVKARSKSGDVWSALHEAAFSILNPTGAVRFTELMYNPPGEDTNSYEFIEFKNTGKSPVDMSGMWVYPVTYTFPAGSWLNPGEYAVLAHDGLEFSNKYPNVVLRGVYQYLLPNNNQFLALYGSNGQITAWLHYYDSAPWPEEPDGDGYSLVAVNPDAYLDNPTNWRASAWLDGSPGKDDLFVKDLANSPPAVSADGGMLYFQSITNIPIRGLVQDDSFTTNTLAFAWSKADGTGDVTFAASNALQTTMAFSTAGVYTVKLAVSDGEKTNESYNTITVATEPSTNNMIFWFRSDYGIVTNESGNVTNWADKTANGNMAFQPGAGKMPVFEEYGYKTTPGMYFDGSNDVLVLSNSVEISDGGPYTNKTLALAFRTADNVIDRQVVYEQGGTNSGLNVYLRQSNLWMGAWNYTVGGDNWGGAWFSTPVMKDMQYVVQLDFGPGMTGYVNGVEIGSTNGLGTLAGSSEAVCIGGISGWSRFAGDELSSSTGCYFKGWVSEAMQFRQSKDIVNYQKTWSSVLTACDENGGPTNSSGGGTSGGMGGAGGAGGGYPPETNNISGTVYLQLGQFIPLNDDDDNGDGTNDLAQIGPIAGENELQACEVVAEIYSTNEINGVLTLNWIPGTHSDRVKLWSDSNKTTPTNLPMTWSGTNVCWSNLHVIFWIEGTNVSASLNDVGLRLKYDKGIYHSWQNYETTVYNLDLLQVGFDATDTNKEITLKKTGSDTYTNDTYVSNGDTTITDPVWKDLNLDNVPDVNPADPVCFTTGAVMKVAGGGATKLDLKPNFGSQSVWAKLKVEVSTDSIMQPNLVFGPYPIHLTGSNVSVTAMAEASNTPFANVVDNFSNSLTWKISLDDGATWNTFQTMTQQVLTVHDTPKTDYCSNVGGNFPYTWSTLALTAKRMDWATKQGLGWGSISAVAVAVQASINNDPGFFPSAENYHANPFVQLDKTDAQERMGDCISLANLAATDLRLLGLNGRPCRAWCVHTVETNNAATWGWQPRQTHPNHADWYLGYWSNNFEGFFYIGDANPPSSGDYPSSGWPMGVQNVSTNMPTGKERYLPLSVLALVPVSQLWWQAGNNPDVEWKYGESIAGVTYPPLISCTTWSTNTADDGDYPITWSTNGSTLTLTNGAPVSVTANGTYTLSCDKGAIYVSVSVSQLPSTNYTGTMRIVPARDLGNVP